jgi:HPr kinase/phosphorylase
MGQIHATCIAINGQGVILRGPSGSGKSDLALRLIDAGAELVADDRVDVKNREGQPFASAPETLKGLLEVRGVGLVEMPCQDKVGVVLVIDLVSRDEIERMPEPEWVQIEGVDMPVLRLDPFEVSSISKIRMVLEHLL